MRIPAATICIVAALIGLAPGGARAQGVTRDAAACATLTSLQIPGLALSITKAEWIPAGSTPPAPPTAPPPSVKLPAYCRLDGVLDRRTGADGKSYGIGFALALPGDWNGRFLFQGGGGLNGTVGPPFGAVATAGSPALARGFAVASTDSGHQGQVFDASFMAEQQASLDFAYQAVGRVAELARQIIARHYARPADKSYFAGCSTGGREAMMMTQRYPLCVRRRDRRRAGDADELLRDRRRVGGDDAQHRRAEERPGRAAGAAGAVGVDKKLVIDGALNACDANDGVKDGMIFDQRPASSIPRRSRARAPRPKGA